MFRFLVIEYELEWLGVVYHQLKHSSYELYYEIFIALDQSNRLFLSLFLSD